jgi:3D (Asp-Asp-Asp) domain-containing protein
VRVVVKLIILLLCVGIFLPSQAANVQIEGYPPKKPAKKLKVRLTAYWCGQDPDTSRFKSSTGYTLKSGRTCAVDPRIIPYGSTVIVEGKEFKAIDTGSAVVTKKASRGRLPVVDLFFKTEKQALLALDNMPTHTWVEIK